jgi:hypothetical protein
LAPSFEFEHSCLYDGVVVISIGAVCMAIPVVQRPVDTVAGGIPLEIPSEAGYPIEAE